MAVKYRPEIDGLRAFAVIPIVLFHAGVPGFSGGFVGVDIFFVISGFLITSGIIKQYNSDGFSIIDFYERRARRIFPALFVVLLVTSLFSALILLPDELEDFPSSVIGTIFFISNIVFWKQSGYFSADSDFKPLLHTWSLGVEEQFYIFAPFLFVLALRYARHRAPLVIFLCAAVSFAICVVTTRVAPSAAFYLIPARAWELFAGALIAFGAFPTFDRAALREVGAGVGLVMVLAAIALLTDDMEFPSYVAALPVTGAALIIAYGKDTRVGILLAQFPFRGIGLISYSLYLWHWPLIVFARDLGFLDGLITKSFAVVAISVGAAYLSWRFVEAPFRRGFDRKQIFIMSGACAVMLLAVSGGIFAMHGMPSRFTPETIALANGAQDISPERERCHTDSGAPDIAKACVFGTGPVNTAVWADSHGVELSRALSQAGTTLKAITYSSCPPSIGFKVSTRRNCELHNRQALAYLTQNSQIKTVYVVAYFSHYIEDKRFAPSFVSAIHALVDVGKTVIVIGPVPGERFQYHPKMLARGMPRTIARSWYEQSEKKTIALLRGLETMHVKIIWPADSFCRDNACALTVDGHSIFFDEHHLSLTGASTLVARTGVGG